MADGEPWVDLARPVKKDDEQRGLKWRLDRFLAIVTGSIIATILGKIPYGDRDYPTPPGMSNEEWNVELLFRRQTAQMPDIAQQLTGDWMADHMFRGTVIEPAICVLLATVLGVPITELPSIPLPTGGIRISPDGLVWAYGVPAEFKSPARVRTLSCARHASGDEACADCRATVLGIYADQVQAELETMPWAAFAFFTQLRSREFIAEVLGFADGKYPSREAAEAAVEKFALDLQYGRVQFPPGKTAADYIYTIRVPRDPTWGARTYPVLAAYADRVRAYREKHGVTFETYAKLNNLS